MPTGRRVRDACGLLGWGRYDVQRRTGLPLVAVDLLMGGADTLNGTTADATILEDAFRRAGLTLDASGAWVRRGGQP